MFHPHVTLFGAIRIYQNMPSRFPGTLWGKEGLLYNHAEGEKWRKGKEKRHIIGTSETSKDG